MKRRYAAAPPHFSQALVRVPNQALRTLLLCTPSAQWSRSL